MVFDKPGSVGVQFDGVPEIIPGYFVHQRVLVATNGDLTVYELPAGTRRFWRIRCDTLRESIRESLIEFFEHPAIDFHQNGFRWYPEEDIATGAPNDGDGFNGYFDVRLWPQGKNKPFSDRRLGYNLHAMSFLLREELS